MIRLLRIEFYKIKSYKTFWAIIIGYCLLVFLVARTIKNIQVQGIQLDAATVFSFPDVWHNIAYLASFLNLLLGILIILMVTNEFSFRTFRQNVIDGLSRAELILAKLLVIAGIALICGLFVFSFCLYSGLSDNQFKHVGHVLQKIYYIPLLIIQIMGYLSLAAFLAFLIKRAALSIVAFLSYAILVEWIIRLKMPDAIAQFFPMKVLHSLITLPGREEVQLYTGFEMESLPVFQAALFTAAYIALFMIGSYAVIRKTDL